MNTDQAPDSLASGVMGVIASEKPSLSPEEAAKWYARKFIREGPMTLHDPEKRKSTEYYFFLFNDVLVGVKRAGLPRSMGGSALAFLKGKVTAKFVWDIQKFLVSDAPDAEGARHAIQLIVMGKTYTLCTDSEDSKQYWIFDIVTAQAQIEKRKSMCHHVLVACFC